MCVKFEGKSNITAEVLCDSVSEKGTRLVTLEVEYPRIILAELNTHRMLSKNSSSSRAIPFKAMIENLNGIPARFGAANSGMQDTGEAFVVDGYFPEGTWGLAKDNAIESAKTLMEAGYHKQVYNRLLEPFQMMKTIISATEWNNFFHLRLDEAADPTIQELARVMKEAIDASTPTPLEAGQWHLPKVNEEELEQFGIDNAIKMSCARCAAVSYRKGEYSLEKCLEVYSRLVNTERVHASALEHAATPITDPLQDGVTHATRDLQLWGGNFRGWVQHRHLIPNESVKG